MRILYCSGVNFSPKINSMTEGKQNINLSIPPQSVSHPKIISMMQQANFLGMMSASNLHELVPNISADKKDSTVASPSLVSIIHCRL